MHRPCRSIRFRAVGVFLTLVFLACGTDSQPARRGVPPGPHTFARKWYTDVARPAGWPGLPGIASGVVILGSHAGVAAFDTATGRQVWTATLWHGNTDAFAANVATGDGRACIADALAVACVDAKSGGVLWMAKPDSSAVFCETVISHGTWFYGTQDHKVYAVDPATGVRRWVVDIAPAALYLTRVYGIAVSGDTVYATTVRWLTWNGGSLQGSLVALDRNTGRELWRYTTPGPRGGIQGAPVLTGRLAILNDAYAHVLIGVDRTTGHEVWRTAKDASSYISAETPPEIFDDTVYSPSTDTQIYALDPGTGAIRWRVRGSGDALGSIAICGENVIAVPFAAGKPDLVNRTTRAVAESSALVPGDEIRSRVAIAGTTAFAAGRRGVYAFSCG